MAHGRRFWTQLSTLFWPSAGGPNSGTVSVAVTGALSDTVSERGRLTGIPDGGVYLGVKYTNHTLLTTLTALSSLPPQAVATATLCLLAMMVFVSVADRKR